MRKWLNKDLKGQGFTYTELVVSLMLVMLLIGPICMSFITSRKIYATSEAIEKGVYYTESLMENVKQQLREDIKLKRQKENIQIVAYPNSKVSRSINLCLENDEKGKICNQAALEEFLIHMTASELEACYETQRYAYKVEIWSVDELLGEGMGGKEDKAQLLKTAEFYSDPVYQGNVEDIQEDGLGLSVDEVRQQSDPKKIKEDAFNKQRITITAKGLEMARKFNETSQLEAVRLKGEQIDIQKPVLLKNAEGQVEGLVYTITSQAGEVENSTGIIEVNVNGLLRHINKMQDRIEVNDDIKTFTLQFINETASEQIIRIVRDACEEVDTLEAIDEKIKVSILNPGYGKTNIVRTKASDVNNNFIIVIITRDKLPIMGKKGKVVKKMIDFYSGE